MKNFLVLIMMIGWCAAADTLPVPEKLKDGQGTVQMRDGKTWKFNTNEYAVVRRGSSSCKPPTLVCETPTVEKLNRVLLHIGVGHRAFDARTNPTSTTINSNYGILGGVSYERKVGNIVVSGTVLTNETFMGGVGLEF